MVKKVNDIKNINIKSYDIFEDENENNMPMFAAKPVVYDFIPNDEKFNKNNGFCVSDVFVSLFKNHVDIQSLYIFVMIIIYSRIIVNVTRYYIHFSTK